MKFLLKKEPLGPHNIDVLSVLFGGLLGDVHGEKRSGKSRFQLKQSHRNQEYLHWLHRFLSERGYCCIEKPRIRKLVGQKNKAYFFLRVNTYTFGSLNWLFDAFYPTNKKKVPSDTTCKMLLTPLAIAVWISDDGHLCPNAGLLIATDCFSKDDVVRLCQLLKSIYGLDCRVRYRGKRRSDQEDSYAIYILRESLGRLRVIVGPFMRPSMMYKLSF